MLYGLCAFTMTLLALDKVADSIAIDIERNLAVRNWGVACLLQRCIPDPGQWRIGMGDQRFIPTARRLKAFINAAAKVRSLISASEKCPFNGSYSASGAPFSLT